MFTWPWSLPSTAFPHCQSAGHTHWGQSEYQWLAVWPFAHTEPLRKKNILVFPCFSYFSIFVLVTTSNPLQHKNIEMSQSLRFINMKVYLNVNELVIIRCFKLFCWKMQYAHFKQHKVIWYVADTIYKILTIHPIFLH